MSHDEATTASPNAPLTSTTTSTTAETDSTTANIADKTTTLPSIRVLPRSVVDRIAAGEVVQRASAAVKELLENSLDAGATSVTVTTNSIDSFAVADNGHGISVTDLPWACVRHATSKLRTVGDLQSMASFGFRGEALASLSAVAKVKIVTRTRDTAAAYQMDYEHGRPVGAVPKAGTATVATVTTAATTAITNVATPTPTPTARTPGTTVTVTDLFYNLPHRRRTGSNTTEYQATLKVVQLYAIHCANQGVSLACLKTVRGRAQTDLATASTVRRYFSSNRSPSTTITTKPHNGKDSPDEHVVTKHVICSIFGSNLKDFLVPHKSELQSEPHQPKYDEKKQDETRSSDDRAAAMVNDDNSEINNATDRNNINISNEQHLIYSCTGYVTSPSYHTATYGSSKSSTPPTTILFVNHRLVECPPLTRALDDVYARFTNAKKIPLVYLSVKVPPETVDVNVHPTKRRVVLLHLDTIVRHVAETVQDTWHATGHTFATTLTMSTSSSSSLSQRTLTEPVRRSESNKADREECDDAEDRDMSRKRKEPPPPSSFEATEEDDDDDEPVSRSNQPSASRKLKPTPKTTQLPQHLVRTSRVTQSGSLEPFLVPRQSQRRISDATTESPSTAMTDDADRSSSPSLKHLPMCPLQTTAAASSTLDLSIPGAFATAARQCTCPGLAASTKRNGVSTPPVVRLPPALPGRSRLRLTRLPPNPCSYRSIQALRDRVRTQRSATLEADLRSACFVGTVSQSRSLIQCGPSLVLWNHGPCAAQLFYQLALSGFGGGCEVARLGEDGVDIARVIGQCAQLEDDIQSRKHRALNEGNDDEGNSEEEVAEPTNDDDESNHQRAVSETNQALAEQASACLLQQANMLLEYFSLEIKANDAGVVQLTGLPVLLEGYEPSPHGLPLFLLRLATLVDWTEEQPCFRGVCTELGHYYAQLPSRGLDEAAHSALVQHVLFPAVSALLVPSEGMKGKELRPLTDLPKLYRVFERC